MKSKVRKSKVKGLKIELNYGFTKDLSLGIKNLSSRGQKPKSLKLNVEPKHRPWTFDLRPLFFLLTSLFLLPACTPLFVPPVRASLDAPEILDLAGSTGLRRRGERLELSLQLNNVPQEGWLAVQWYSPENALVASDSQWIEPQDEGFARTYGLPGAELSAGDWRAVVSFEDDFIRQFGVTVAE